jgi:hypothetical protein
MAADISVICGKREALSFCRQDWTGQIRLNRLSKLACTRRRRRHIARAVVGYFHVPERRRTVASNGAPPHQSSNTWPGLSATKRSWGSLDSSSAAARAMTGASIASSVS